MRKCFLHENEDTELEPIFFTEEGYFSKLIEITDGLALASSSINGRLFINSSSLLKQHYKYTPHFFEYLNIKLIKPNVSIIIPSYGECDKNRITPVLDSIIWQSCVDLEIILVESSRSPSLRGFAKASGAKYCFLPHPNAEELYRPGRIRNLGISNSSSNLIYVTDADIIFKNRFYLANLLHEHLNKNSPVLRWPPMRRIPVEFTKEFIQQAIKKSLKEAMDLLDYNQDYIAIPLGESYSLRVVKREKMTESGQVFTTRYDYYKQYFQEESWQGLEPLIWHQIVHIGGILMSRKQLLAVGGYCEDYIGWGNEDIDLQWKLCAQGPVEKVPNDPELEVLHMDHEKPYLSRETWVPNKVRFEQRKKQGVAVSVQHDRATLMAARIF